MLPLARRLAPPLLFGLALLTAAAPAPAGEVRVAVASNFLAAARDLAKRFEKTTPHRVILSPGATGRLFAQIMRGAPHDVFLAADAARPEKLEAAGRVVPGGRFTYALGRLALWSPRPGYVDPRGDILESGRFDHLAIANPRLAPYGRAARETLIRLGLWERLRPRLVRGENIGQTFHFIRAGAAPLGFIAAAQLTGRAPAGSRWIVPKDLHAPIRQQAALLRDAPAPRAFFAFLRGAAARALIAARGYDLP